MAEDSTTGLPGPPQHLGQQSTDHVAVYRPGTEELRWVTFDDPLAKEYFDSLNTPTAEEPQESPPPAQTNREGEVKVGDQDIYDYMEGQVTDPQIPESAIQTYTPIEEKEGETLDPQDFTLGSNYDVDDPQKIDSENVQTPFTPDATTYQATQAEEAAQMVAATGEVPSGAYVSNQLENLLAGLDEGELPYWSRNAVVAADKALADRGFGRSNVAQESLYNAIISSALPIAQSDAETKKLEYFTNLSHEQKAEEMNMLARQEVLLTDVAADNAAKQFNSTSQNQLDQFRSTLQSEIELNNAARRDAMEQFNVNAQMAIDQYNSQTRFARDNFNASMAAAIEQSNAEWRRQINTVNTAGVNAVNQANAMNAFNLSNQALTFLWQEARDYALWSWTSSENEEERKTRLAIGAMGAQAQNDAIEANFLASVGNLAWEIFDDIINL